MFLGALKFNIEPVSKEKEKNTGGAASASIKVFFIYKLKNLLNCVWIDMDLSPAQGESDGDVVAGLPASTSLGQPLDWELLPAAGERPE